jgi:group I intron endonuclease
MYIVLDEKDFERSGIYAIVDRTGICRYVGQAHCFQDRWKSHKGDLRRNKHINYRLQGAWNEHGEKYFGFEVLEFCIFSELNAREQYWIDKLNPDYNIVRKVFPVVSWPEMIKRGKEYTKDGESFRRPIWHLWVYGGYRRPTQSR